MKPSWEDGQELVLSWSANRPSQKSCLCTPLPAPSVLPFPHTVPCTQSLQWGNGQCRHWVQCVVVLPSAAVPLESCLVGPTQAWFSLSSWSFFPSMLVLSALSETGGSEVLPTHLVAQSHQEAWLVCSAVSCSGSGGDWLCPVWLWPSHRSLTL